MSIPVINIEKKFELIKEFHSYKAIAKMNDCCFKLVRMKREFIWHSHEDTDEAFIIIDGELKIELRDETLILKKGDMVVIPRGVEHKPASSEECRILMIEPAETVNTGNAGGSLTDLELEWI